METTITAEQRALHVTSEALALAVVAPFMFYLASRRELPPCARAASAVVGVATLLVDGELLRRYLGSK